MVRVMSIKNKLNRLKPHLTSNQNKKEQLLEDISANSLEIPFLDKWEKENVYPYFFDNSFCLVREKEYSLQFKNGLYSFSHFQSAVNAWNNSTISHPLSTKGYQPESLFFFDTETTGLGGGVGNSIFILGHASLTENKIKLKQHILPHPGAEIPLYQSFLESINYHTMITYNGKAFDWPQVKTRHTLIRENVPKLPPFGHFDLYHASRRMWKHKLERLKLSIVEKEVLGIERKDDIPGFLAPMIYFDFVERKDPEGMIGVLKHNEQDILSLISLYTHISYQLLGLDNNQSTREVYEIGRWFSQLGDSTVAKKAFSTITDSNDSHAQYAKHALAFEFKKQKMWEKCAELWIEVAEKGEQKLGLEACIELAKLYEHREIDLTQSLFFTEKAEKKCREAFTDKSPKFHAFQTDIHKRKMRLIKKLSKQEK